MMSPEEPQDSSAQRAPQEARAPQDMQVFPLPGDLQAAGDLQAPGDLEAPGDLKAQRQMPGAQSADPLHEPEEARAEQQRPEDPESADDVLTHRLPGTEASDAAVLAESRRHTRRSFVVGAAGTAAGYAFYEWLEHGPQEGMQRTPIRRAFDTNAALSRDVFREHALAPTYPLSRAETLRVNGVFGLKRGLEAESYRLQVVGVENAVQHPRYAADVTAWEYRYTAEKTTEDQGHDTKTDPRTETKADPKAKTRTDPKAKSQADPQTGLQMEGKVDARLASSAKMAPESVKNKAEQDENHTGRKSRGREEAGESYSTLSPRTPGLLLTIEDVLKLPRHELVTQFKCIEGWSQVVHWAGVRMADFLDAYPPASVDGREPRFVYMETPDGDYYVGYDLKVCRHPQTLLVTEMMGAPLTQFHGAPLRIHMPTKYGYKQIKRIGLIAYTNEKPDDYWTELGYDWYAGL